jgi:hypothetical protein
MLIALDYTSCRRAMYRIHIPTNKVKRLPPSFKRHSAFHSGEMLFDFKQTKKAAFNLKPLQNLPDRERIR